MQRQHSVSDKLLDSKSTRIDLRLRLGAIPFPTLIGFVLLGLGIVVNRWLLTQIGLWLDVPLNLAITAGTVRVWLLKILLFLVSFPLLLYGFRSRNWGRPLFDAAVGICAAFILIIFIDGFFFMLNRLGPQEPSPATLVYSDVYVEPHQILGYKLKPEMEVAAKQLDASDLIYDVTYSTNKFGRRVTAGANNDEKDKFILFLGGSFTFGDGVSDDETLPAHVARLAPDYEPYNYGVSGYGTQQVLLTLQQDSLPEEVNQSEGLAIYTFICPHVRRVIGASEVHNTWGGVMPFFTLDQNGDLVRRKNFVSGRPATSTLYNLVGSSEAAKYFHVVFPLRIEEQHIALTVKLIEASREVFHDKFGQDALYVLFYPESESCAEMVIPHLEAYGIKYLDYSNLFDPNDGGELAIPDGHPTARAYELVAKQLVEDLALSEIR